LELNVKKALALVLLVTSAAFQLQVHAAESSDSDSADVIHKPKVFSPEAKAQRSADRALAHKVRVALTKNNGLDVSKVTVLAKRGTVTLTGSVTTNEQIQLAQSSASSVSGVSSIKNDLVIDYPGH
jgi:hyperosmotically inducible periplasmic protein